MPMQRLRTIALLVLALPGCFSPTGQQASTTGESTGTGTSSTTSATSTTDPTTTTLDPSTATTDPGSCGDGVINPGEQCDDGNTDNDDECTVLCAPPTCGDGFKQNDEYCDDGNTDNEDGCTEKCLPPACGDGYIQLGEACDDGLENGPGKPCHADCTTNTCGDGDVCHGCLDPEECEDDGPACDKQTCTFKYRLVFVTSNAWDAVGLGGLEGADAACQTAAQTAGNELASRTFVAWLSTSEIDARDRLDISTVPYELLGGTVIANSTADLVDITPLANAINVDEYGFVVPDTKYVWTGTTLGGTKASDFLCDDWTMPLGGGRSGRTAATDGAWTDHIDLPCTELAHLYCFQIAG